MNCTEKGLPYTLPGGDLQNGAIFDVNKKTTN